MESDELASCGWAYTLVILDRHERLPIASGSVPLTRSIADFESDLLFKTPSTPPRPQLMQLWQST
jgi:hypothetical protein